MLKIKNRKKNKYTPKPKRVCPLPPPSKKEAVQLCSAIVEDFIFLKVKHKTGLLWRGSGTTDESTSNIGSTSNASNRSKSNVNMTSTSNVDSVASQSGKSKDSRYSNFRTADSAKSDPMNGSSKNISTAITDADNLVENIDTDNNATNKESIPPASSSHFFPGENVSTIYENSALERSLSNKSQNLAGERLDGVEVEDSNKGGVEDSKYENGEIKKQSKLTSSNVAEMAQEVKRENAKHHPFSEKSTRFPASSENSSNENNSMHNNILSSSAAHSVSNNKNSDSNQNISISTNNNTSDSNSNQNSNSSDDSTSNPKLGKNVNDKYIDIFYDGKSRGDPSRIEKKSSGTSNELTTKNKNQLDKNNSNNCHHSSMQPMSSSVASSGSDVNEDISADNIDRKNLLSKSTNHKKLVESSNTKSNDSNGTNSLDCSSRGKDTSRNNDTNKKISDEISADGKSKSKSDNNSNKKKLDEGTSQLLDEVIDEPHEPFQINPRDYQLIKEKKLKMRLESATRPISESSESGDPFDADGSQTGSNAPSSRRNAPLLPIELVETLCEYPCWDDVHGYKMKFSHSCDFVIKIPERFLPNENKWAHGFSLIFDFPLEIEFDMTNFPEKF